MTTGPLHVIENGDTVKEIRTRGAVLAIGDLIILARNKAGWPTKTLLVKRVERGESCNGMHINVVRMPIRRGTPAQEARDRATIAHAIIESDGCYDRAAFVDVLRKEAALIET